jgi:hyperosmotically inducible periplasmic protein
MSLSFFRPLQPRFNYYGPPIVELRYMTDRLRAARTLSSARWESMAQPGLTVEDRARLGHVKEGSNMNFAKAAIRREFSGLAVLALAATVMSGVACNQSTTHYKDSVKTALEQADLKDVTVSEDAGKNTITLGGTLHSDEAKTRAANVAQAGAGPRIIANEISVEPVGNEGEARKMESNLDDGIESNFKAVLISKGLDKQHIRYNAKNGALTLKGSVKSSTQRQQAQELAKNTPNVQQVVNELQVER